MHGHCESFNTEHLTASEKAAMQARALDKCMARVTAMCMMDEAQAENDRALVAELGRMLAKFDKLVENETHAPLFAVSLTRGAWLAASLGGYMEVIRAMLGIRADQLKKLERRGW